MRVMVWLLLQLVLLLPLLLQLVLLLLEQWLLLLLLLVLVQQSLLQLVLLLLSAACPPRARPGARSHWLPLPSQLVQPGEGDANFVGVPGVCLLHQSCSLQPTCFACLWKSAPGHTV